MPAIQLARLKILTVQLADSFSQPAVFLRRLHDLLEFYSDRTYRPGQSGRHIPLMPHYRVAQPVIRQVELEIGPLCSSQPQQALDLADLLWADEYLEPRIFAIYLLSQVPPDPPEPVIQRIHAWARPEEESQLLASLLSSGTGRLQRERPDLWQALIEEWLHSPDLAFLGIGLRALLSLANDPNFENLPVIFRLLSPAMQTVPTNLQADYLDVIESLARRTPTETAFFLRQSINASRDPATGRLVRKTLPFFSPDLQAGLRAALVNRAKSA